MSFACVLHDLFQLFFVNALGVSCNKLLPVFKLPPDWLKHLDQIKGGFSDPLPTLTEVAKEDCHANLSLLTFRVGDARKVCVQQGRQITTSNGVQ